MFESTGWILEEPDVSDATKFDLISPTVVKPATYSSINNLQEVNKLILKFSSALL